MRLFFLSFIILQILALSASYAQISAGRISDFVTDEDIEFVEIGILNHNTGTISDIDGRYQIDMSGINPDDTLRFSHTAYKTIGIKVSEYLSTIDKDIKLTPKNDEIETIVVNHRNFRQQTLGNNFKGDKYQGGFIQNVKGFECGVLLKIEKRAILQKLIMNISDCAYENIYFRVNVYKETGKNEFQNILGQPIYLQQKVTGNEKELVVDLSPYFVHVEGNTLITLQHIANIGMGQLLFAGSPKGSTSYYRTSSQGRWTKAPMKLSFRVEAMVEK